MATGDRALGLAPSAYLQLGERALLRLSVHVRYANTGGTGALAMLTAPPVPTAETHRGREHAAHEST